MAACHALCCSDQTSSTRAFERWTGTTRGIPVTLQVTSRPRNTATRVGYVPRMSDVPSNPDPIIPDPDPTHTPTIPDPDPGHEPVIPPVPDPDPDVPEPGPTPLT